MAEGAFTPQTGTESRVETETLADDVVVVAVHGEADLHFAPELRETFDAVIDDGPKRVLVDLSDTVFIDSMALGVLLAAMRSRCWTVSSSSIRVSSPPSRDARARPPS
jgi:anti-anti-sigma factor